MGEEEAKAHLIQIVIDKEMKTGKYKDLCNEMKGDSLCSICLENFTTESPTILHLTPCEHLFHAGCMLTWL